MMTDRYRKSRGLLARAERSLAGGVSSNVRRSDKPLPMYFDHGLGSHLFDVDGNRYVDYVLGRGPLILGHTNAEVIDAMCRQLQRGKIYAAQHELEIELAERIVRSVPSAEMVRFGISGSEAVHGALRLARAFTCISSIASTPPTSFSALLLDRTTSVNLAPCPISYPLA